MKLLLLCVLSLIIIVHCDCKPDSWFPNVLDKFTNRTSAFTSLLKEKGRDLKNYYVQRVRSKITSFLGMTSEEEIQQQQQYSSEVPSSSENPPRIKRNFSYPATEASVIHNEISNDVAATEIKYKCIEDDPTVRLTTTQLLALHGYKSESHTIVTDDGYILTIHRIPFSKNNAKKVSPRNTILLHHGLFGSSADWVIPGPEKGLAYYLSEAGYDIWLANARGNTYSRAHVSKSLDSFEFWNYTFHEIAVHDLPAVIDYIMEVKGYDTKIDYIGHSMGTTVLFALLSTKRQYNKILRAGYALAPVVYMSDIRSPLRLLARYSDNLEYLLKLLGTNEFLPQSPVVRWLARACDRSINGEAVCQNIIFVIGGYDADQFNKTLLPMILGHIPAGISTKTIAHFAQEIKNGGNFQQFDYGLEGNFRQYGTVDPPQYPIDSITLPIALFSAQNDLLAGDVDVTKLYVQLRNPIEHYIVSLKEFNHFDFIFAVDAPKLVFSKLLQLLEEGASSSIPFEVDSLESNVISVS